MMHTPDVLREMLLHLSRPVCIVRSSHSKNVLSIHGHMLQGKWRDKRCRKESFALQHLTVTCVRSPPFHHPAKGVPCWMMKGCRELLSLHQTSYHLKS